MDYDSNWKTEFAIVKEQLLSKHLINKDRIEHIGSTSIPDMRAKPIIDIMVGLNDLKLKKQFEHELRAFSFYRLKVEKNDEIVFAKFKDKNFQMKTHFIHAVIYEGKKWNDLINFRNYLIKHEDARKEYIFLKESYLKSTNKGILDYTNYKENFIKNIIQRCEDT